LWADLSIYAWDIDYDAPDGERDLIYVDGQYLGTLYGYDGVWATTTFTVPTSLLSDGALNVWLDIDSTHSDHYWAVTIGSSTLRVGYILKKVKNLKISATDPIIPRNSGLIGGRVLTRSDLNLYLTQITEACVEEPAKGVALTLQSDRGIIDSITQPRPTNADGETTAQVATRDQLTNSGTSTITSSNPDVTTIQPAVITWLPAQFEPRFLITCYSTELESDYPHSRYAPASSWEWCPGHTPPSARYRVRFMDRVRFQGSGIAEGGEAIQYNSVRGCYYISSCPLTASGECAQVGITIAVDRKVIPFRGTVNIESVGLRRALDTGGAIRDYHIDVYNGIGRSVCSGWQNENSTVEFLNY